MPFWKCYYHVIWATKYRKPCLIPIYETVVRAAIEEKCIEFESKLWAVNMVEDHIHAAVSIPPGMAVSKWIGGIKGASARAINTSFERDERFHWQEGYGVMSFGEKNLPVVLEYIANQKERHAAGNVNAHLEHIDDD